MAVRRSLDGPRSEILILNVCDILDIYPVRSCPKRPGLRELQTEFEPVLCAESIVRVNQ